MYLWFLSTQCQLLSHPKFQKKNNESCCFDKSASLLNQISISGLKNIRIQVELTQFTYLPTLPKVPLWENDCFLKTTGAFHQKTTFLERLFNYTGLSVASEELHFYTALITYNFIFVSCLNSKKAAMICVKEIKYFHLPYPIIFLPLLTDSIMNISATVHLSIVKFKKKI